MILLHNYSIQITIIIIIKKENHIFIFYKSDVYHIMLCLISSTGINLPKTKYVKLSMISKEICAFSSW
jgi:hypothetical protein